MLWAMNRDFAGLSTREYLCSSLLMRNILRGPFIFTRLEEKQMMRFITYLKKISRKNEEDGT
jgi:hypothetical protein